MRGLQLTLDKAQTAWSCSVTGRQHREYVRGNTMRAASLWVSLHRLTTHRFDAYKRLKSSLWLSSPFPSDTMLSSLSISSASTYTHKRCWYILYVNVFITAAASHNLPSLHNTIIMTCLKLPFFLCSQSIMSWKIGIIIFRTSVWGTKVTPRKGPIIPGMKWGLLSPGLQRLL